MRFDLSTLFQLVSFLAVCLWLVFSPSILTIVPGIFLLSFFGSIKKKTALRGMLIGLSVSAAFLVLFWLHSIVNLSTSSPPGRPPESGVLEVFILPALAFLFIFAPISAAIGGAAGALNEWIGKLQDRKAQTAKACDDEVEADF
jgi:hypothetical protein